MPGPPPRRPRAGAGEPFPRPSEALRRRAARVDRLLEAACGPPPRPLRRDPISVLVLTILSQHTSDVNSRRAFERVRARSSGRSAPRAAPRSRARASRPSCDASPPSGACSRWASSADGARSARAWLCALDGVGPKTGAIVLVFGLGKPAFEVDTHAYRVARRLGLIPGGMSVEGAHGWLEG